MSAVRWGTLALAAGLVAFGIGDKERGNRLYRAGKYQEAAAAYAQALQRGDDSPELHYNYGTALLRLGRYAEADQQLKAALRNVEPKLREKTLYNLGNRYLYEARAQQSAAGQATPAPTTAGAGTFGRAGPAAPATSPGATPDASATRPLLDGSIKSYEQALRIDPHDGFAKWNLELALKQKKQSGGGGGAQQNKGGGGGGQQKPSPQAQGSQNEPQPNRSQMNQAQADRILSAAENDERQLYKEKVRKGNRETPVERDW